MAQTDDRLRWIKFWPEDWQRDPALRTCGLAARGLWMELLCVAHEGTPYGHVTINGRAPTPKQIGNIVGVQEKEAVKLLRELEDAGVFSRTEDNVIYSRRMVKDKATRDAGRAAGYRGGNPKLKDMDNGGGYPPSPRGGDNGSGYPEPPGGGLTPPLPPQEARGREAEAEKRKNDPSDRQKENDFVTILPTGKPPELRLVPDPPPPEPDPARGSRLAENWRPSAAEAEFARSLGLDPGATAERFRDFWRGKPGKDGRKADWPATWRNWCRNQAERRGFPASVPRQQPEPTLDRRYFGREPDEVGALPKPRVGSPEYHAWCAAMQGFITPFPGERGAA